MFGFLKRPKVRAFESLMEQTRDLVVCIEFSSPVDTSLRGDALNKQLRAATVVDASQVLAKYFGFKDRQALIGSPATQLFDGAIPDWFIHFGRQVVVDDFRSRERIVSIPIDDTTELYVRMNMQNIMKGNRMLRQWITFRDVTKAVKKERQAAKDLNTKVVALEVSDLHAYEVDYHSGEVTFDPNGLAQTIYAQKLDGTFEDWVKRIDQVDIAKCLPSFNAFTSGKQDQLNVKFRLPAQNNGSRWFEAWARAMEKTNDGKVKTFTGVYRDVTDDVELSSKLAATQKLESIGVLAGGIAHDFNNLLMSILGNSELGRMRTQLDPAIETAFNKIEVSAQHAKELCNQLLMYAGKESFELRAICFQQLIENNLELIQLTATKRVNLETLCHHPGWVKGDEGQLLQVILNLVSNATEAFDGGSRLIRLEVDEIRLNDADERDYLGAELQAGQFVRLRVSDTGSGITEDIVEYIFDPFYTTKFAGRGLGLSVVMGVVKSHGGGIRIQSIVDEGSTVELIFPCTDEPIETASLTQEGSLLMNEGRILVVDDEHNVRSVVSHMLKKLGATCTLVASGAQALLSLSEPAAEYDAVLLDITMPGMDGLEVARKMINLYPDLPIILSSGFTSQKISEDLQQLVWFLKKPYSLVELSTVLSQVRENSTKK